MGRMVSRATCACALLSATASCGTLPEAAAPALENFAVPASAVARAEVLELGGGCSIDTPKVTDRRSWSADGRSVAERLAGGNVSPAPRLSLDDGRALVFEVTGNVEWGFSLRARALGRDGAAMGPPVTISTSIVGRPLTASEPGHLGLVFLEDADYGLREVGATVHCSP